MSSCKLAYKVLTTGVSSRIRENFFALARKEYKAEFDLEIALVARIIGSGIRIKLGIWRDNLGDRHLASSLVAGDPGELGELTLSATLTQTQTQAFGEFGLKLYTAH